MWADKFRKFDLEKWAIVSLLVLWVSTTFSPALMRIAFGFALVFWIAGLIKTRIQIQPPGLKRVDWVLWGPLVLFYVLVVVSFFTSEYPKESLRGLWKIALPLLIFLMNAHLFRGATPQKQFFFYFVVTCVIVIVDSSVQYVWGKDLLRQFPAQDSSAGLRLVGPFGDFGKMAAYLILVIPVFMMQGWSRLKEIKSLHSGRFIYPVILAVASLVLLYLTRTRGALLALMVGLFCLFVYKRWFKILGAAFVLCLALLAIAPRAVIVHQNSLGKEQSVEERIVLWMRALDVIRSKPFWGTGINTYDRAHAKYDSWRKKNLLPFRGTAYQIRQNDDGSVSFVLDKMVYTSDENQTVLDLGPVRYNLLRDSLGDYYLYNDLVARGYYAHNGYLQLAAETGIPCILAFLVFWGVYFYRAVKHIKELGKDPEALVQLGILTGLLAFLIYALVDTNLQSPQSLVSLWFMAGILLARQQIVPGDLKA